jgi:hypothetical protein
VATSRRTRFFRSRSTKTVLASPSAATPVGVSGASPHTRPSLAAQASGSTTRIRSSPRSGATSPKAASALLRCSFGAYCVCGSVSLRASVALTDPSASPSPCVCVCVWGGGGGGEVVRLSLSLCISSSPHVPWPCASLRQSSPCLLARSSRTHTAATSWRWSAGGAPPSSRPRSACSGTTTRTDVWVSGVSCGLE